MLTPVEKQMQIMLALGVVRFVADLHQTAKNSDPSI